MCGIAGIIGQGQIMQDFDLFEEMIYASALRGHHSTGIMVAGNKKSPVITKRIGSAWPFLREEGKNQDSLMRTFGMNVRFAHCRSATVGDINIKNAHPFRTPNLIGMHNGTLVDYKYLKKDVTDSELLFQDMEEKGIVETLRELSPKSAYAIAVYDRRDKCVYLARNTQRELAIALNKTFGMMYFMSEFPMLFALTKRNHEDCSYAYVNPGQIMKIDPMKVKPTKDVDEAEFIEYINL